MFRSPKSWTEEDNLTIIKHRIPGHPDYLTWDKLSILMGFGRNTVLEKGRRISNRIKDAIEEYNATQNTSTQKTARKTKRPALPAGHPFIWNLINSGLTTLADSKYPYPVFCEDEISESDNEDNPSSEE